MFIKRLIESYRLSKGRKNIKKVLSSLNINNYMINDDLSVDVYGNVMFIKSDTDIPIKFRNIYGNFNCSYVNLTTLKNSPDYVYGYFSCCNNNLDSLEFAPLYIEGDFDCSYNSIESLKNFPKVIGRSYLSNNNIRDLKHYNSDREILLNGNPINNIFNLFYSESHIELFNDYNIIKYKNNRYFVNEYKLISFLEESRNYFHTSGSFDYLELSGYIIEK